MGWGPAGCLSLLFFIALLFVPFLFANLVFAALAQLGLGPGGAFLAAVGIFFGGLFNIPVKRVPREQPVEARALTLFGLDRVLGATRRRPYTIVAVNLGGCVIPCLLVLYEVLRIAGRGTWPLMALGIAVGINVGVCHRLARPVENVGIALPALVPALAAAASALILLPGHAAPLAFSAGVLGPLVGADLLHLRDIGKISAAVASIGGAGTFDGIVLSGLVATLLAS
jgi:uncharacterized membrane protein